MTREEAIERLRYMKNYKIADEGAIDMAISALSAETVTKDEWAEILTENGRLKDRVDYLELLLNKPTEPSDLISRAEAKKAICKACLNGESIMRCKHKWNCPYLMELSEAPSVSAKTYDDGYTDGICEERPIAYKIGYNDGYEKGKAESASADRCGECRKELEDLLKQYAEVASKKKDIVAQHICDGISLSLGSIPAERVGEWEYDYDKDDHYCTRCHKYAGDWEMNLLSDYCPSCGARMENEK